MNRTLMVVLTAVNAGLYTVVGYLTYFGILVGGVRFWPAVVVPGLFAVLFGPYIGGVGAAIGIFLSDMLTHGMPLLSLSVGVTSNFFCFYIIGYITRNYNLKKYLFASIIGELVGSAIIVVGLWAWSLAFLLPGYTELTPITLYSALTFRSVTFISEMIFLIIVVPPMVEAARKALPSLVRS